jgi:hypothetical protein
MSARVGVLVAHGMGSQGADFADGFIRELDRLMPAHGVKPGQVRLRPAWWAEALEGQERQLWDRMDANGRLGWRALREFVVSAFGDALAYRTQPGIRPPAPPGDPFGDDTAYARIHRRIHEELGALAADCGDGALLVVAGHSLGSVILSDHIWDLQHGKVPAGTGDFAAARTLAGCVTFGSTLPLFALDVAQPIPIKFPAPGLPDRQREAARWLNFYGADDVLGYPLRATCDGYAHTVDEDIMVRPGNLLTGWNPASHLAYWECPEMLDRVARLVAGLVKSRG